MTKLKDTEQETVEQAIPPRPDSNLPVESQNGDLPVDNSQDIDEVLNSLKSLLSSVEKLQKVRQEVGDIKPLVVRMLDGEMVSGEELEQLKVGIGGLFRLVRAHGDHQSALSKAQPARHLLDEVLKTRA